MKKINNKAKKHFYVDKNTQRILVIKYWYSKKQFMHVALKIATYDRTFWVFQYSVGPLVSQLDLSGEPKLAFRFKWWLSKLHGRFAFLSCLCRYTHHLIYTFTPRQTYCH